MDLPQPLVRPDFPVGVMGLGARSLGLLRRGGYEESIRQVAGKILALERGEPVAGAVDSKRGY